jgi:hypothetical protein
MHFGSLYRWPLATIACFVTLQLSPAEGNHYWQSAALPTENRKVTGVAFLSDSVIAISSIDGVDSSITAALHGETRPNEHLSVDIFSVKDRGIEKLRDLQFDTDTSHAKIAALPSGQLLVGADRHVSLLSSTGGVVSERSAESLCGVRSRLACGQLV